MGMALPVIVTMIIILILTERIKEVKIETSFNFKSFTVLVAESNIVNREILAAIMEKTSITIDFAESDGAAISMFEKNPGKYNVILIEVQTPDTANINQNQINGFEIARAIRAIEADRVNKTPIIAMLSKVTRENVDMCLEAGMNAHLEKPFNPDKLYTLIKQLVIYTRTQRKDSKHNYDQGIAWSDNLTLGDEQVDAQHLQMFGLLSGLVNACADGSNTSKLKEILDFLADYAVQHFRDEEALMLRYNYPELKKHQHLHEKLKVIIDDLVERFKKSGSSVELSNDIVRIVVRGLTTHIMHEDKKIVSHIRSVTAKNRRQD
jgi:hemerythrin